jgi:beta-lactamase class A
MTTPDIPPPAEGGAFSAEGQAAVVLRAAAEAVEEGADVDFGVALERIAAACPGTLAVAVRPAAFPAGGVPLDADDHRSQDGRPAEPPAGGLSLHEDVELPLASVGKLLLLAEVAMSVDGGILDPDEPVRLRDDDYCGGSGLLRRLSARAWTVGDLALLTAAVSDNTATNALLRRIGLDRVNAAGAALGLTRTRLLDRIREQRGPQHPPTFAMGTAGELAGLAALVAGPAGWQALMREWMLANTDHGLVPALLGHDPEGGRLAGKTGTDDGIRTDVGLMGPLAYAVLACGPVGSEQALVRAVRQAGALVTAMSLLLSAAAA